MRDMVAPCTCIFSLADAGLIELLLSQIISYREGCVYHVEEMWLHLSYGYFKIQLQFIEVSYDNAVMLFLEGRSEEDRFFNTEERSNRKSW